MFGQDKANKVMVIASIEEQEMNTILMKFNVKDMLDPDIEFASLVH